MQVAGLPAARAALDRDQPLGGLPRVLAKQGNAAADRPTAAPRQLVSAQAVQGGEPLPTPFAAVGEEPVEAWPEPPVAGAALGADVHGEPAVGAAADRAGVKD